MKIETFFAIGAGLAAFVSAVLWVLANRVRVRHIPQLQLDEDGMLPFTCLLVKMTSLRLCRGKVN